MSNSRRSVASTIALRMLPELRALHRPTSGISSIETIPKFLRDQSGDLVRLAAIHRSWHRHVDACWAAGLNPLILAPMAHGKTVQLVIGRVCHFIGSAELERPNGRPILGRNARIKIVCNDEASAADRVRTIGENLESPEYHRIFPSIVRSRTGPWNTQVLNIQRDPRVRQIDSTVAGKGILSTGIGGRADLLVFDDIVDFRNCIAEPANRKKINETFGSTWMSRLEPWGKVVMVGTRWHALDLYGILKETQGWCCLEQAISDDFRVITCKLFGWDEKRHGTYPPFSELQ